MITSGNLLEQLVERVDGGRVRAAFFSTYTFGPEYFAAEPLPAFTREGVDCGVIPVTVIVDSKRYRGSGRGYEVVKAPFKLWHPKAVLLMVAQPGTRYRWTVMAIGSGNLTRAGWEHNQEFFVVDSWGGWCIPKSLGEWLEAKWLRDCAFARWCKRQNVKRKNADGNSTLLSSVHEPLWPRLALEARGEKWTEAHVLAPFSDQSEDLDAEPGGQGGGFLKALVARAAPAAALHVYLRGLAPDRDDAAGVKVVFDRIATSLGRSRLKLHVVRPLAGRLLHAKLLAWKSRGTWTVVAGSPNATRAAMLGGPAAGNVEIAWQFARIGRTLPESLFPKIPALTIEDVTFHAPTFDERPSWDAVESAKYDPTRKRVVVNWREGWDRRATELHLAGRAVEASRIALGGTEDRALEVLPRRKAARKNYRASWVPIAMPEDLFDSDGSFGDELTPDEWLQLIGDPFAPAALSNEGGRSHSRRRKPTRRKSAANGNSSWDWNTRVRALEGQVAALADAVRDAETEAAVARLVRVLEGAWSAHDPRAASAAAARAWCKWVRAGIVDALRIADGRMALHRPLCALRNRWEASVDWRLVGGRDV